MLECLAVAPLTQHGTCCRVHVRRPCPIVDRAKPTFQADQDCHVDITLPLVRRTHDERPGNIGPVAVGIRVEVNQDEFAMLDDTVGRLLKLQMRLRPVRSGHHEGKRAYSPGATIAYAARAHRGLHRARQFALAYSCPDMFFRGVDAERGDLVGQADARNLLRRLDLPERSQQTRRIYERVLGRTPGKGAAIQLLDVGQRCDHFGVGHRHRVEAPLVPDPGAAPPEATGHLGEVRLRLCHGVAQLFKGDRLERMDVFHPAHLRERFLAPRHDQRRLALARENDDGVGEHRPVARQQQHIVGQAADQRIQPFPAQFIPDPFDALVVAIHCSLPPLRNPLPQVHTAAGSALPVPSPTARCLHQNAAFHPPPVWKEAYSMPTTTP